VMRHCTWTQDLCFANPASVRTHIPTTELQFSLQTSRENILESYHHWKLTWRIHRSLLTLPNTSKRSGNYTYQML